MLNVANFVGLVEWADSKSFEVSGDSEQLSSDDTGSEPASLVAGACRWNDSLSREGGLCVEPALKKTSGLDQYSVSQAAVVSSKWLQHHYILRVKTFEILH